MSGAAVYDVLEWAGEAGASLVLPGTDWVHRRVQSIRYVEPELMEVRLSIDFTLPQDATASHVPLTVLPKWPPLFRFDYTNARGEPIPLLTSEENGFADYGLMNSLTKIVAPVLLENDHYVKALSSLTKGPETHLDDAFNTFFERAAAAPNTDPQLLGRLVDLGAALTDSTLLWCPTGHCSGQRTLIKLRYMLPIYNFNPWHLRILRSLAWYQPTDTLPLRHLGADANYHVELEAPPLLLVRSIEPKFLWLTSDPNEAEMDVGTSTDAAELVGLRPEQYMEYEGRFAHVYVSGRRPMGADLYYCLAPARAGFVAAAFCASVLVAIFVTLFYSALGTLSIGEHLDGSVALLALVPVLIAYLVVRPSDPPLVRRHLLGVQILAMASAAVPIVMGALLLVYAGNLPALETTWIWGVIGAWVLAFLLLFSVLRAGTRPVL